jgi:hypothetical protein
MGELIHSPGALFVIRVSAGNEYAATDVREPDWGNYCPHGLKIVEAEPAEHLCEDPASPRAPIDCRACYPAGRKILPWPCNESECTEEAFDRAERERIDEYYEEMRAIYYG